MKKIGILTAVVFFCCLSVGLAADVISTKAHSLDNGLTVLVTEMPASSTVSVYGLVKAGSATEGKYLGAGLTHFMEHMLFKGTARRGPGDIPNEIQSLGGTINASTGLDYTIYTITVPKEKAAQAADILSDMLFNAKFDPQELEREREVVFSEIRLYRDRPEHRLSELVFATAYQVHPYRIPVIGFKELLAPLTRENFLDYYHSRYVPNNIIVSFAGGIDAAAALELANQYFGGYPRGKYALAPVPDEPLQRVSRVREEYYSTTLIQGSLSYQGVDVNDEDMVALDALAMILGQGRGSRLFQALVERRKVVHSVSVSNFTPKDPGLFEIEFSLEQGDVDEVVSLIEEQIQEIQKNGVTEAELEKVVNSSLKDLFLDQETSWGMAYRAAVDLAVAGDANFTQWYAEAFRALTSRDIQDVAQRYLKPERRSLVVLRPKEQRPAPQAGLTAVETPAIKRQVMEDGLTVLTREDHRSPLVWINLVFNGGLYQESEALNGICNMLAGLWPKGSKQYGTLEIAAMTEQKGMSLSGFSGKNSFGLKISCLSRDTEFAISLLADLVLRPTFPQDQFDIQKERILTAIVARQDDITTVGSMALDERLFPSHPLGRTVLGTTPSVSLMSRADVQQFYQMHVVPKNAVLSVFGDIETPALLQMVQKKFKGWNGDLAPAQEYTLAPLTAPEVANLSLDKEQAAVLIGFRGQSFYHADRYGLEVLAALLGSPFRGRMFSVIREEKGLAYTLGGGYTPARDSGEILFYVQTSPKDAPEVETTLRALITALQEQGVSDEELESLKQYLIGRFEREIETNGSLAFMSALDELYGLGYQDYEKYVERIKAVTPAQIQELARTYFNLGHSVFVTVVPAAAQGGQN